MSRGLLAERWDKSETSASREDKQQHSMWPTRITARGLASQPRVTARIVAQSGVTDRTAEIRRYRNTQSGAPIMVMTLGLLTLTGFFAYDLYQKKRYPWQHGHDLRDLFKRP